MRHTTSLRRLALVALVAALSACGAQHSSTASMAVGAGPSPESQLLANLYAAALRSYGTPTHVEVTPDPMAGLDSGSITVVPGLTGTLLDRFAPGSQARSDELVYRAMVGTLPEGLAAGDYATAAEDKPAAAVTERTVTAWGDSDLPALVAHCNQVVAGAARGRATPSRVGACKLPKPREFPTDAALFEALQAGQVNVAWTTTADPDVPPAVVVLADRKPMLIQAENVVPLYRRNELTARQVLAINEVAGVLDTAALKAMRTQIADGADPQQVAEAWLADNPLGR
ncbi:glycine betaine ABC transporter substrate-binding protein [Mycolicibacterium mengxianglii]|uniref:glycine betaine ABC transporter substrate-binding protein n=1 Tax=Mycolicibacterium mengxianglii TaxID=2736649 RepID=UPI0018D0BD0C|nr:glycine betaine ABC transporter substrate-binding protein [Mycolicibacterium mengxianglii]